MKKVLAIAVLGMITLTACKKDYTCTCKAGGQTTTTAIKGAKKKDADTACSTTETNYKSAGFSDASCSL